MWVFGNLVLICYAGAEEGPTCCDSWHDHWRSRGDHCGYCNSVAVGWGAGIGWENHRLFLCGRGQNGCGAQLGQGRIVVSVRLGQDVGYKVGAGRSCHDDHLNVEETFKTLKYCVQREMFENHKSVWAGGLTFCVVVLVVWMVGLVKVILTGDRCGGRELAMLCMMLLILGLPLTGTEMFLDTCGDTLVTSFSITGDELDEFVRLRLRGFSSSSEQLTPAMWKRNSGYIWNNISSSSGDKS